MATYFQACKAERIFKEYRELATKFWEADMTRSKFDRRSVRAAATQGEGDDVAVLRERINKLSPFVQYYAQGIGMNTKAYAMPPAMIGGTPFPFDFLTQVLDGEVGYSHIPVADVLDSINRCIGAAELNRRNTFWKQALNPFYYLTLAMAFVLRVPFMMLEAAGIPEEVEKTIWAHIVKVLFLVVLIVLAAHYGLKANLSELLKTV